MGHQLNIKSDLAYGMASELAALTGESLTGAVVEALRERLERTRRSAEQGRRAAEALAIAAEIRAMMDRPVPGSDHSWMYDDVGLPR